MQFTWSHNNLPLVLYLAFFCHSQFRHFEKKGAFSSSYNSRCWFCTKEKKKLKSPTSWLVRQFSSSMVTQECHNFIVYDSCNVPSFLRPWLSRLSLLLVGRTTVSHWFDFNFKEHSCLLLSHLHHPWKRVLQVLYFKLTVVVLEIWRPVYRYDVKRQAEHQRYKVRYSKVCDQKFIGW